MRLMVDLVKFDLANELRPVLLRLARRVSRESNAFGISAAHVALLGAIHKTAGVTAGELAEREQVSAPAMSRHLAGLEDAGLISRKRAEDRRRAPLLLTDEGRRVLRSVRRQRTAWLAERLDQLPDESRWAIEAAIEPLQSLLEMDPQ
jgi:DNA-binding MarR family transcriptional regulator